MNDSLPLFDAMCMETVMSDRTTLLPGPDHPITIRTNPRRVVVKAGGKVIADTTRSLSLAEARYPVALYVPRADVDMSALARSQTRTYCPYKGEAAYFGIPAGGQRSEDAVWSYEAPHASVEEIRDHLAFYPDRVDSIEQLDG